MREIKFRAWHMDDFEMYYFEDFVEIVAWQGAFAFSGNIDQYRSENPKLGSVTFMQFTGLKDINGVDIYEGDIVRCKTGYHEYVAVVRVGEYLQDGSGREYESVKCYGVHGEETKDSHGRYVEASSINDNEIVEVLGNEFEHPHLLK